MEQEDSSPNISDASDEGRTIPAASMRHNHGFTHDGPDPELRCNPRGLRALECRLTGIARPKRAPQRLAPHRDLQRYREVPASRPRISSKRPEPYRPRATAPYPPPTDAHYRKKDRLAPYPQRRKCPEPNAAAENTSDNDSDVGISATAKQTVRQMQELNVKPEGTLVPKQLLGVRVGPRGRIEYALECVKPHHRPAFVCLSSAIMRKMYPKLLLDYFETHVGFVDDSLPPSSSPNEGSAVKMPIPKAELKQPPECKEKKTPAVVGYVNLANCFQSQKTARPTENQPQSGGNDSGCVTNCDLMKKAQYETSTGPSTSNSGPVVSAEEMSQRCIPPSPLLV